jgi:hypothetical protein
MQAPLRDEMLMVDKARAVGRKVASLARTRSVPLGTTCAGHACCGPLAMSSKAVLHEGHALALSAEITLH